MPGSAQTNLFMLSSATVMIGPMADLHKMLPATHSIGLVKNFQLTADPQYVELTQGITNDVVASVRNAEGLRCAMEVYEMTARNLGYAAGLDASGISYDPLTSNHALATALSGGESTVVVTGNATAAYTAGTWLVIQEGLDDKVHVAKVASSTFASNTTITLATGFSVPTGATFAEGSRVAPIHKIDVGGLTAQPNMAAKIVGVLPEGGRPFVILMPKIKITKGLGVAFQTDNFGNLPFEFTPYAGVPGDAFYTEYGNKSLVLFPGN